MNIKPILPFPCSEKLYKFILRNRNKIFDEDTMIVGILWGNVGCGKSVRAQEFAYVINGNGKTELDMISFTKDEFVKSVLKYRKSCLIPDEGISIFFSRGAMTKEGRLMAELMGQCRQKNNMLIICIPDILSVDSLVLNMANFIGYVWESRKVINDRFVTIKGNMRLYPHMRGMSYKNRIIQYLRIKKSNPLIKMKMPQAWLTESGSPYGEGFKGGFYAVDEEQYKQKKESILEKYRKQLERKPRNKNIDFPTMDRLMANGMQLRKISAVLNVSYAVVKKRKREGFYRAFVITKQRGRKHHK